jgi:DNA-binding beta-propeller fold protein YncE
MSIVDDFRFEPIEAWEKLPADIVLGDVAGVTVDSQDRVYLFNRGTHPVVVLNREGTFLNAWGEGVFSNPHGASIGPDDSLYLTDNGDHTVRKFTTDGKLLLEIGVPNQPAPFMSGQPFCRCTHTALSPQGEIYVSDGYWNACVHKFSPTGKHIKTWGRPGTGRGEFNLPHNICCDAVGQVYVADRENHRVQIFDGEGEYLRQIANMHRACALAITPGAKPYVLVGEQGPYLAVNRATPNLGPRVSVFDNDGELVSRIGAEKPSMEPGAFVSPHSLALDSHGDLYVGEVVANDWHQLFPDTPRPDVLRRVQKFRRVKA